MYSTTIRENLDPLKTSTDDDMWSALESVKGHCDEIPGKIGTSRGRKG